jgi:RNA polymerase sigma-70 factor (ECF subfamily)
MRNTLALRALPSAPRSEACASHHGSRGLDKNAGAERLIPRLPLTNETLAQLYATYGSRLYRYAAAILADRGAAEDAVQDAFVRLARALRNSPELDVSLGYLSTVVRNECYTALRRRRRRAEDPEPLIEPRAPEASEEERTILEAALRALPPEQREVVYLKVFEGMTFREIADHCGISINTAASRYRYAAAALRRELAPTGKGT